jgi:hypothetical protein
MAKVETGRQQKNIVSPEGAYEFIIDLGIESLKQQYIFVMDGEQLNAQETDFFLMASGKKDRTPEFIRKIEELGVDAYVDKFGKKLIR